MRTLSRILFLLFLTAALPGRDAALSQTSTLSGVVIDRVTREPLPGANVQVLETRLGGSTGPDGIFTIASVPYGSRQLRVSLVGYRARVIPDVIVASGRTPEVRIALDQDAIGLETVEVTADLFTREPDAPVSTQRLSYEEIRRSPGGFEDVVRALSVLPGVSQVQPGRNDLAVRGGAPSENLFVVENIEVPNINHFGTQGASGGPISFINLDFVRETSFSSGGFGVRYGDRMSSVLTVDFRDGRSDRLGGKATVSASMFGLDLEGPAGGTGTFLLSARRSYLDLIFRAAGFSFVPEYWDFTGKATFRPDGKSTITVTGIGALDDVRFFNRDADDRFDNSRILGTDQRQYVTGITWQRLLSGGFFSLTLGRTFVSYAGAQRDSLLRPVFSNRSKEGETSLRADWLLRLGAGETEVSFGSQIKRVRVQADLVLPGYVSSFGDTLDVSVSGYDAGGYKGAVYAQVAHTFPFGLQVSVGGRLDYFGLIDRKLYGAPRASLAYPLTRTTTVTASTGLYYQSPSSIWLVSNTANRGLSAARVAHFIVGIEELVRPDLKLRVEGFVKTYRDYPASADRPYLVLANTGGGFGGTDDNFSAFGLDRLMSIGKGRSVGIEFLAQKKLSDIPLYGLASLTVSRTTFTAADGIERPGAFDQEVLANASGGYRFNEEWEASLRFRFATGRPYTPFEPDGSQDPSRVNSLRIESSHSLDIRVDRRWNFESWNLIVYLDIQNVYNNKITGGVRWNARERRVETDDSAIGILPSIGVSAEF